MFTNFKLQPKNGQAFVSKIEPKAEIQVKTEVAYQLNVNTKEVDIFPNFEWE